MLLKIILHDSDGQPLQWVPGHYQYPHIYTPGEGVSGIVRLELHKEEKIQGVTMRFQGKFTTLIPDVDDNRTHSFVMFNFERTLYRGPVKLAPETHQWPFSFRFPESFHWIPETTHIGDLDPTYNMGRQTLPPSMTTDVNDANHLNCVTYKLRATIQRSFTNWDARLHLRLSAFRLEGTPEAGVIRRRQTKASFQQQYRYTEAYVPRSLTAKESLSSKFRRNSQNQTAEFSITASAPTRIVLGEQYPVYIELCSPPTDMVLPEFYLQSVRASLVARTHARVPMGKRYDEKTIEHKIPLAVRRYTDRELPPNAAVRLDHLFAKAIDAPPSFSAPTLCREYGLELDIKFTSLDKVYESLCTFPTVVLFPAKKERGVQEAIRRIALDNALPAYEPRSRDLPLYQPENLRGAGWEGNGEVNG